MTSIATTWGSFPSERALPFPCDRTLPGDCVELYRAVTVEAPAPVVFRWLCQLRVAPYSYDFLDNLGRRSPRTLTPGLEELALGQRFMIFSLIDFERDRHVTLRITEPGAQRLFGAIDVSYLLLPEGGRSRLVVKLRVPRGRDGVLARLRETFLAWGDLVMMRKQLLTLKELAEEQR